jgi:hypothetical protein
VAVDRNAAARLRTILASEEYGPKLARLHGAEERRVLDLIDANRGREARAEILRADAARLERERQRRRALLIHHAAVNTVRQHRAYGTTYDIAVSHLRYGTDANLRKAATASKDELDLLAREPPRELPPRNHNPFWYH